MSTNRQRPFALCHSESAISAAVDEKGFWCEISAPFTQARHMPISKAAVRYLYYYGCVFKVTARVVDDTSTVWRQIDDEYGGKGFFVRAEHIRPIPPAEFTPISPAVPMEEKHMEVDPAKQTASAYEGHNPVISARVTTGASFRLADGIVRNFGTTPGTHRIHMKLPSQPMVCGAARDNDDYDLPRIVWVSYFTSTGIVFHGTDRQNVDGTPRCHGCVNMLPEDAKRVFLWTRQLLRMKSVAFALISGQGYVTKW
ncbi:MAG TPA: L,D-transpeptidase [Anaerolineae bacterium]|jgi:hypothetical protein